VRSLAAPQGQSNHRPDALGLGVCIIAQAGIVNRFGNDERFAVLHDPPGDTLAHFHAQSGECILFAARGNGVVELLRGFVEHQQGPQLRFHDSLHLLKNCAENGVEVEARVQRARQLMEDQQVFERDAPFRLIWHRLTWGRSSRTFSHICLQVR